MLDLEERYKTLDMDNKLIWNFRDIGHFVRNLSEGKGSQKRILIILLEEGTITQRDLTERLGIQPGSASETIGKLENAGLIVRTQSNDDRRTTNIVLTDEGRIQAAEAAIQRKKRHETMFSCLTAEEKETMLKLLEKVNSDWKQRYGDMRKEHCHQECCKVQVDNKV